MSNPDDHFYGDAEYEEDDDLDSGEECGRWDNGRLTHSCSKAGSEECDFICPHRKSLKF